MTTAEPTAPKLPRRLLWYHPAVPLVLWLGGVALFALGALETLAYPFAYLPGAYPFLAVVIGLAGGFAFVARFAWRGRKQSEDEARWLAFGEVVWSGALPALLPLLGIVAVTLVVPAAVLPPFPSVAMTWDCFLLPLPLFYHVNRPVCERAAELLIEASAVEADTLPAWLSSRRVAVTLDVLVALSAVGALAIAAWLQSL